MGFFGTITGGAAARILVGAQFLGAGTDALPALVFPGSLTTGLFQPAADTCGISVSTTEVLRVDSAGVGISTVASPSARLHVLGTTVGQVTSIFQAVGAQTADVLQIQTNAGAILDRVTINGDIGVNGTPSSGQVHVFERSAAVAGLRSTGAAAGFNQLRVESTVGSTARMLTELISNSGTILIRLGVGHLPFSFNAGITASSDVIMAVVPVNTATTVGCFNPSSGVNALAGFRCGEVVDGGNEIRIDCLSSGFTTNQLNVADRSRIFCRAPAGLTVLLMDTGTSANYQIAVSGNNTDNVRFIVNNSATTKGVTIGRVVPTGTEALLNVHLFDAGIIGLAIEAEAAQTANLLEIRDSAGAILLNVEADGDTVITGTLTVGTAPTYANTNGATDRTIDFASFTLAELGDVVSTMIDDFKVMGLFV